MTRGIRNLQYIWIRLLADFPIGLGEDTDKARELVGTPFSIQPLQNTALSIFFAEVRKRKAKHLAIIRATPLPYKEYSIPFVKYGVLFKGSLHYAIGIHKETGTNLAKPAFLQ